MNCHLSWKTTDIALARIYRDGQSFPFGEWHWGCACIRDKRDRDLCHIELGMGEPTPETWHCLDHELALMGYRRSRWERHEADGTIRERFRELPDVTKDLVERGRALVGKLETIHRSVARHGSPVLKVPMGGIAAFSMYVIKEYEFYRSEWMMGPCYYKGFPVIEDPDATEPVLVPKEAA